MIVIYLIKEMFSFFSNKVVWLEVILNVKKVMCKCAKGIMKWIVLKKLNFLKVKFGAPGLIM